MLLIDAVPLYKEIYNQGQRRHKAKGKEWFWHKLHHFLGFQVQPPHLRRAQNRETSTNISSRRRTGKCQRLHRSSTLNFLNETRESQIIEKLIFNKQLHLIND